MDDSADACFDGADPYDNCPPPPKSDQPRRLRFEAGDDESDEEGDSSDNSSSAEGWFPSTATEPEQFFMACVTSALFTKRVLSAVRVAWTKTHNTAMLLVGLYRGAKTVGPANTHTATVRVLGQKVIKSSPAPASYRAPSV
jgi:hypothetical protein